MLQHVVCVLILGKVVGDVNDLVEQRTLELQRHVEVEPVLTRAGLLQYLTKYCTKFVVQEGGGVNGVAYALFEESLRKAEMEGKSPAAADA